MCTGLLTQAHAAPDPAGDAGDSSTAAELPISGDDESAPAPPRSCGPTAGLLGTLRPDGPRGSPKVGLRR